MILQQPIMLVTALLSLPLFFRAFKNEKTDWKIVGITNALLVLLLAVAAASPAVQTETEQVSQREIIYLNDKSASMMTGGPNISIEGVSINSKTLASGNTSNLQKALLNRVESNKTYLVRTDLQGLENTERIVEGYNRRNSSINVLKTDLEREASVSISGPDIAVPGAQNSYTAKISATDTEERRMRILVDGEEKNTETTSKEIRFTESFDQEGYHRIEAQILNTSDKHSVNNKYYKSVKVIEKPELLVIGDEGQLNNRLSEFYDITRRERVPDDLSQYYSVVLKKNLANPREIRPYLIDGNGLMYTGDGTMDILPIEDSSKDYSTSNPKIIIGIDISQGIGEDLKTSKNYSTRMIGGLKEDMPGTQVGVFAYNESIIPFGKPRPLFDDAYFSRLMAIGNKDDGIHSNGVAHQIKALRHSKKMIDDSPGNIVFMTDLEIPGDGGVLGTDIRERFLQGQGSYEGDTFSSAEYESTYLDEVSSLSSEVRLHIVITNVADEDYRNRIDLERIRENEGSYVYEDINEFEQYIGDRIKGGGGSNQESVSIYDNSHYITRGISDVSVVLSELSEVRTRESANKILSTSKNRPALSTWRYGLGRVAAFSADNSDLDQFLSQEPGLVSRTVSWTVGDPQRKENSTVNVDSPRRGGQVVISSEQQMEGLTKKSENRYEARIRPNETGFHSFQEHEFTYNYRKELQGLGYRDSELEQLASRTGGEVLTPEELDSLRSEATVTESEVTETRSLSVFFLLAALLVFLGQAGYRKFNGLL